MEQVPERTAQGAGSELPSKAAALDDLAPRRGSRSVPRVTLTLVEAASALGVSEASFRRHVLPELRVVRAGPRLKLVRVAELVRWAQRREAIEAP